ncbi:ABC transporter permease [Tepidibacter hydrothermalis]|uniref:ABC transporter permease n=1 Tax=Tepidibacter hydrothermalis TaxID=3036126 RepID=A0ABY8EGL7_9FIRM|nr:ABC transporter permease [Tepidibacter hydrothermalis]WFD10919.1 ABC transporter permease [Tepidibacter hydrothermalis]
MIKDIFNIYIERWDFFSQLIMEHIILTSISVIIIAVLGLTLGIAMTRNKVLANIIFGVTNFLYTIPSIALFGVLVTFTGIGNKSAIIALSIYGIVPVIRNTYVGIMQVDKQVIESAIGMGTTKRELLFRIQLPLALPVIFTGFRTMVIMTIALCGIASFIGAGGLGVAIWRGISTNFPTMTMAGSLLVAALAIITDLILQKTENIMTRKILGNEKMEGYK